MCLGVLLVSSDSSLLAWQLLSDYDLRVACLGYGVKSMTVDLGDVYISFM